MQRTLNIEFDNSLPINQRREDITEAIQKNQVVIICGETGSGKTTQLPKICLALGRGVEQRIGHTQPRRIAARAVASRIAEELKSSIGELVGFKIRFDDKSSSRSRIKLMTDGILLAEIQSDPLLRQYDTIIIDEAHERSLNIDFLLGYLQQLTTKRSDLKIIITSATIDPHRFSKHFNDAPIVEVSGRTYPVKVLYREIAEDENSEDENRSVSRSKERSQRQHNGILNAIKELSQYGSGDILIFFSGERDIKDCHSFLKRARIPQSEVLPLFSRLSTKEQNKIFSAHSGRRIILSTNVAETSLTVPGIRYVIDTGTARVSRYSHRSGIQRLPIEKISQAAANQRKGRCGRVSDGVCIRLYSEEDFTLRPLFTDPEILRTHLAPVILQMAALNLGSPSNFPFIDPPDLSLIKDGERTLYEIGAMDKKHQITPLGKKIGRFPVDPQIARMLLAAEREGCLNEILIIAAALTIQDPRERPLDAQQAADEKHAPFADDKSDFILFINLWNFFQEQRKKLSNSQLRKLCKTNFLNWMRMREWMDIHTQLLNIVRELKLKPNTIKADYGMVHRALLSGLLSHIAMQGDKYLYNGVRGVELRIWPGSTQFKNRMKWMIAAEKVETSQLYARTVAAIEPEWIERIGKHLLKRNYAEPHWEKSRGQVAAFESITLYGLPIVSRRKVNFGSIEPAESRKIFIRSALVEDQLNSRGDFLKHNRNLIDEVEKLEAKSRRRDILIDAESLYLFYDELIPAEVRSLPTFEKWRIKAEKIDSKLLFLSTDKIMQHSAEEASSEELFPDHLTVGNSKLPLSYHFDPESREDGVTLTLPAEIVSQINRERTEWLVPGLLRERVIEMLRALPKKWRRNFVPVADFADAVLSSLDESKGALGAQLSSKLRYMTGVTLPEKIWDEINIPEHLQMSFKVIDRDGKTIHSGRDLSTLLDKSYKSSTPSKGTFNIEKNSRVSNGEQRHKVERQNLQQWDFGDIPTSVTVRRHGIEMTLYPALTKPSVDSSRVDLTLVETAELASTTNQHGITTLFLNQYKTQLSSLIAPPFETQSICLQALKLGRCKSIINQLLTISVTESMQKSSSYNHTHLQQQSFEQSALDALNTLPQTLKKNRNLIADIVKLYHQISNQLKGNIPPSQLLTYSKIKSHLDTLVYPNFITNTPLEWLTHLPRYLKGVERRIDKLSNSPDKDRVWAQQLSLLWDRIEDSLNYEEHNSCDKFIEYRWMLEEYRISLFAQELGTVKPVSVERLNKLWRQL